MKVSDVFQVMLEAAHESLADDWPEVQDHARAEMRRLAQSLVDITKLVAMGKINGRQAKALVNIHKNTTTMVLLTLEGLGIIAVENAINAALRAARDTVNAAAGLRVL